MIRGTLIFTMLLFSIISYSQISIADARNEAIGQIVTVEGVSTNGAELGIIRYLQDDSGAIAVYPGTGSVGDFPGEVSRGSLVRVTGEIKEFNGLLEIDALSAFEVISENNPMPDPLVLTPAQINEDVEAVLVKVNSVKFTAGGNTFSTGNYEITSDGETSEIYVRTGHPLIGEEIPLATVNLTGIVSQFNSIYQVLPRGMGDLEIADAFFLTASPAQSNITQNGFSVSWSTNEPASSVLKYGTTPQLGEEISFEDLKMDHQINLLALDPATFYYVQVCSNNGTTDVSSAVQLYSTASNSSGEMRVFFNHGIDGSFSNGSYPVGTTGAAIEGEIIARIDAAQTSIDASIYNINRNTIVNALSDAYDRGVVVRYIADNETANLALSDPTPDFPIIRGNSDGLMHNKFFVFDADDVDNAWVMSGSTNMTEQNIADDFNNTIFIQDQALAKAYTLEFEEMWGTDGADPGVFSVLFGADKSNNTPHLFNIGGVTVESYFSPSDNTTIGIVDALNSADNDVQFALLTFTNNELGTTIKNLNDAGIDIRGIIDNVNDQGSEFGYLEGQGVNVTPDNTTKSTHHKYAIVDALGGDDPLVVVGSHNWSGGAETRNDENTLIIHDASITNIFLQEFEARWCEVEGGASCITSVNEFDEADLSFEIFPNPVSDQLNINIELEDSQNIVLSILDAQGRLHQSKLLNNVVGRYNDSINLENMAAGNYYIQLRIGDKQTVEAFQVVK